MRTACSGSPPWHPTQSGCRRASLRRAGLGWEGRHRGMAAEGGGTAGLLLGAACPLGCHTTAFFEELSPGRAQQGGGGDDSREGGGNEKATREGRLACEAAAPESSRSPLRFQRTAMIMPRCPCSVDRSTPAGRPVGRARRRSCAAGLPAEQALPAARVQLCAEAAGKRPAEASPPCQLWRPPPAQPTPTRTTTTTPPSALTLPPKQPHCTVRCSCGQQLPVGAPLQASQVHRLGIALQQQVPLQLDKTVFKL